MSILDAIIGQNKTTLPSKEDALPGRPDPIETADTHYVNKHSLVEPHPEGMEVLYVGMGCFWGAERLFWQQDGVYATVVGYMGGHTPNPTYDEVCSGKTGHNEVVKIVYDPNRITAEQLLKIFWEGHDPTQGMRQGNDSGTQYRSAVYYTDQRQEALAFETKDLYQQSLNVKGFKPITTEILKAGPFYPAETYHQQYLAKNPGGYCGIGGTGVTCPLPEAAA